HASLSHTAFGENVHHQFAAMRESAVQVQLAIAAWLDAQPEERTQHLARDEARPSHDHFAVVNGAAIRQRVLYSPRHPDRIVVLYMLRHRGFARSRDRLAQTRHAHPGREPGAEPDLVDEFE